MSLTSLAMVGMFAIVVLLIARSMLRQKDAEMAAMATMMGLQKSTPDGPQGFGIQGLSKLSAETMPPEIVKTIANGDSEVREWSFGEKPEDLSKPGVHFRTHVKVQVIRKKQ